jgi:Sulfotransferase domain
MVFIDRGTVQDLDDIKNFPVGEQDLLVVGFPKSGTSWLQVMITNLWDDWKTCGGGQRKVPSLHGKNAFEGKYYGYADALALESPRLIKTHLHLELMPSRWPERGKVVHITRNPKDVCVSLYHELRHMRRTDPGAEVQAEDFRSHVEDFLAGEVPWGPFTDNVLGWHKFEHPNLLKITYEDARRHTADVLERIVVFVGRPTPEGRAAQVVAETDFETMKNSELRNQINHPDMREDTATPFMRKGIVGDWKDWLTVAQSERMDREIVAPLQDAGLELIYE